MIGWGIFCLILGLGSFILPMFGAQFQLLSLLGEARPLVGAAVTTVGAVLVVAGLATRARR